MKFRLAIAFASLLLGSLVWNVRGGDGCGCCPQCGGCDFKTVCRIVPVITKTPKTEYDCKCEDFCVPGRSRCVGCETVTDCNGNCYQQKCYEPTCGKVYSKTSLIKTTTMVEKCSYKCVAEKVCCRCGCGGGQAAPVMPGPPTGPGVQPHVEPHPLRTQSN